MSLLTMPLVAASTQPLAIQPAASESGSWWGNAGGFFGDLAATASKSLDSYSQVKSSYDAIKGDDGKVTGVTPVTTPKPVISKTVKYAAFAAGGSALLLLGVLVYKVVK